MKIQIITAVKNTNEELLRTANSIRNQTFHDWRWYIANGGDVCQYLKEILEFKDPRIIIVNNKDNGIYDAWNKACNKSKANWTLFLGSGDVLNHTEVLQRSCEELESIDPRIPRIAFGSCRIISNKTGKPLHLINNNWDLMKGKFRYGKPSLPIHPETFHSLGLLKDDDPFESRFSIAGDVDIMLRALRISEPIVLHRVITDVMTGGLSQDPRACLKIYEEVLIACAQNNYTIPIRIKILEYLRSYVKILIYYFLGKNIYEKIKEKILHTYGKIKEIKNNI